MFLAGLYLSVVALSGFKYQGNLSDLWLLLLAGLMIHMAFIILAFGSDELDLEFFLEIMGGTLISAAVAMGIMCGVIYIMI